MHVELLVTHLLALSSVLSLHSVTVSDPCHVWSNTRVWAMGRGS